MTTPSSSKTNSPKQASEFRVGRVKAFLRGQFWHLCYFEQGRRRRRGAVLTGTLLDKGIQFILETCRSMFTFAAKRRYLPPYAENPFTALELESP